LVPAYLPFVNADNIARALRESGQESGINADLAAGRLLIARLKELASDGTGFTEPASPWKPT
jgi:predicted ABC-type ATPase